MDLFVNVGLYSYYRASAQQQLNCAMVSPILLINKITNFISDSYYMGYLVVIDCFFINFKIYLSRGAKFII